MSVDLRAVILLDSDGRYTFRIDGMKLPDPFAHGTYRSRRRCERAARKELEQERRSAIQPRTVSVIR